MRYLFQFGFEDPHEFKSNAAGGWDDESSEAIWINAASTEDALEWGRSVAEQFVTRLFEMAGAEGYSWLARGFAHWIADDETVLAWASASSEIPEADFGHLPDLEALAESRLRLAP
jgi:hypothetical protein